MQVLDVLCRRTGPEPTPSVIYRLPETVAPARVPDALMVTFFVALLKFEAE